MQNTLLDYLKRELLFVQCKIKSGLSKPDAIFIQDRIAFLINKIKEALQ